MKKNEIIEIYVELFDEGTPTYVKTTARFLGNELYEILPTDNYDPEDEIWEFPPHSIARVENKIFNDGTKAILARHQNLNIQKILVEQIDNNSLAEAYALRLPNGGYEILATHNYDPLTAKWKFPPESIVGLEERVYAGTDISYYAPIK